jgi:hypothetical protein
LVISNLHFQNFYFKLGEGEPDFLVASLQIIAFDATVIAFFNGAITNGAFGQQ